MHKIRNWAVPFLRFGIVVLVYAIVAGFVLHSFMADHGLEGAPSRCDFASTVSYEASRPFVFRALTPLIINLGAASVPANMRERFGDWFLVGSPAAQHFHHDPADWTVDLSIKWHIAYFFLFGCLFLTLLVWRGLARQVPDVGPAFGDFAPVAGLLLVPLSFHIGGYIYDLPELLLVSLCVFLILSRRIRLFYVVFSLAVLNKEVAAITAFYLLAVRDDWRSPRWWGHGAALAIVGGSIILTTRYLFRDNAGSSEEWKFFYNLGFWTSPRAYLLTISPSSPLIRLPGPGNLVYFALGVAAVLVGWRQAPIQLRRLVVVAGVINLALFLALGYENEVRALGPFFPVAFAYLCHTVARVYSLSSRV